MTAAVRPRVREDLTVVELDGEAVIYDDDTGNIHHLNPTATIVLSLCDGSATGGEMAGRLGATFLLPSEELEPQIRRILLAFRRKGLLEPRAVGRG